MEGTLVTLATLGHGCVANISYTQTVLNVVETVYGYVGIWRNSQGIDYK